MWASLRSHPRSPGKSYSIIVPVQPQAPRVMVREHLASLQIDRYKNSGGGVFDPEIEPRAQF